MKVIRRLLPYLFLVVLLAAGGLIWWNKDYLRDSFHLRGYTPPSDIATLAERTVMTDYGRRLFYVNEPKLEDKTAFNEACQDLGEEAAVLGCYKGDRSGIHIYNVTDPRLNGIEEVTAAHEMLHQAYDRLDGKTKDRINKQLQAFYDNGLTDESVKSKLAIYQKESSSNMLNEMHSIFGSEVKDLPAELEQYYRQYFDDRDQVVAYRQSSQAEFDRYRNQIADYDRRLDELKPMIDQMEQSLKAEVVQLKAAKAELDADLTAGRINEYNAGVAPYNSLVAAYNKDLAALNKKIEEYNKLVTERNAASVQVSELNRALDSSLTPQ